MDPFLVPRGQHYTTTPYSTFLPATGSPPSAVSPSVMPAPSLTPPDSCICSVHLHPRITHSSALARATVTVSSPPADPNTCYFRKSLQQRSATPAVCPVSRLQLCTVTPVSDCTHLKRTPPAAPGAPAAHRPFGSAAREASPVLWLEADVQRSPRGGTKVWSPSELHGWSLS